MAKKKKYSPSEEHRKAFKAMQVMGNDDRWRSSPPLVSKSIPLPSPTKLYRKLVNSLADATSRFFVGTSIEEGDYVDADVDVRDAEENNVVSPQDESDSVAVSVEAPQPVDSEVETSATQSSEIDSVAVDRVQSAEIDEVSDSGVVEDSAFQSESVSVDSVTTSFDIPDVEQTPTPTTQQEVAATSEFIDIVQPEADVESFVTIDGHDVDVPISEASYASPSISVGQETPPPVASDEVVAQGVQSPQLFPQTEAVEPEPQPDSVQEPEQADSSTQVVEKASFVSQQPVSEEAVDSDDEVVSEPEVPVAETNQVVSSEAIQPSEIVVDKSIDVDTQEPQVSTTVMVPELDMSQGRFQKERPEHGGQVRHDIQSGKRKSGKASKARTQWNPYGPRTAKREKLSTGGEYDSDKPAGTFANAVSFNSGGNLGIQADADAEGNVSSHNQHADDLAGASDDMHHSMGEILERMASGITDLSIRLNHIDMILRRGGY